MLISHQRPCLKLQHFLVIAAMSVFIFTIFTIKKYSSYIPLMKISKTIIHMPVNLLTDCRPFTVSDNRSFFEREYPQSNLPRRLSNSSYESILRQLRSMRLIVVSCARNVERNIDRYRRHIEPIIDLFHSSSRCSVRKRLQQI
jgi:hypothetical protein